MNVCRVHRDQLLEQRDQKAVKTVKVSWNCLVVCLFVCCLSVSVFFSVYFFCLLGWIFSWLFVSWLLVLLVVCFLGWLDGWLFGYWFVFLFARTWRLQFSNSGSALFLEANLIILFLKVCFSFVIYSSIKLPWFSSFNQSRFFFFIFVPNSRFEGSIKY